MTPSQALGRLDWPTLQQIADTEAAALARRLRDAGFSREEALRIVQAFGVTLCFVRCGLTREAAQTRAWAMLDAGEALTAKAN